MKARRATGNIVAGGVLAAAGAFAGYQAAQLPFGSIAQPDSGFFPLCVAVLVVVFALGIVAESQDAGESAPTRPSWGVAAVAVALVGYVFLLKPAGFVICTLALLLFMLRALGALQWRRALGIALPAVLACYVIFTRLGVPLPPGILGI
jgi:hypothetical protein